MSSPAILMAVEVPVPGARQGVVEAVDALPMGLRPGEQVGCQHQVGDALGGRERLDAPIGIEEIGDAATGWRRRA